MKKTLVKKLDKIWTDKIKIDQGWRCEKCGRTNTQVRLNSHHIIGRRHRSLRWVLSNGVCLCVSCHTFGLNSAHEDPVGFVEWLKMARGDKQLKELNLLKGKINKFSYEENLEMMEMSIPKIIKQYDK